MMKLFSQTTAFATLIQFVTLSLLNIATTINSVVTECTAKGSSDCIGNLFASIILYMLIVGWFAFIWVLGYTANERRSKKLAVVLIGAEGLVAMIAYFHINHSPDALSLAVSSIDLALALWIIILSLRLLRAGGSRIGGGARPRRRRRPST